ncbi:MAG TPA: DUF58 domain-containing protein [Verrucomicrobiae bacterium]|jgi:uncharacterized protein (DUF58 family)
MVPADFLKSLQRVEIASRMRSYDLMAGQSDSIFKGRGLDFVDVREYAPGDDVRRIDWNISARLRKPYIKRMVEERELTILLLVDLSASGHFGSADRTKRELAAELAGTLAFSAIRNNDRVGLVLFTDEVEHYLPPRKTRQHVLRLLKELLTYEPRGQRTHLAKALTFAANVTHRPALLFLLSDLRDTGFEAALRASNQRHDLLTLQITDPREQALPDVGWATARDAESGEIMEIDTSDPLLRAGYESANARRQEELRDTLRRAKVSHLEILTNRPWSHSLRAFLGHVAQRRIA